TKESNGQVGDKSGQQQKQQPGNAQQADNAAEADAESQAVGSDNNDDQNSAKTAEGAQKAPQPLLLKLPNVNLVVAAQSQAAKPTTNTPAKKTSNQDSQTQTPEDAAAAAAAQGQAVVTAAQDKQESSDNSNGQADSQNEEVLKPGTSQAKVLALTAATAEAGAATEAEAAG